LFLQLPITVLYVRSLINQERSTMSDAAQSKTTMLLICFFLGGLGIHRKMMGYSNWWLQLITFGGCGIWSLIDLIKIATGSMKMADGRDLT
jgi:TM2 domain-containing membrane protein YozV